MFYQIVTPKHHAHERFCHVYTYVFAPAHHNGGVGLSTHEDEEVVDWAAHALASDDWTYYAWPSLFCTNDTDLAMAFKMRWC